jgi:hypothetical protein
MMALAWSAIIGAAIGFGLTDALNAAGLHWLTWLVLGLLTAFILVGTFIVRKRS